MTHQVFPISPNDLVCDTCPNRSMAMDTMEQTIERARVLRWHVYRGPSLTGDQINKTLCGTCVDKGGARRPDRNVVMEGQTDMMEEFGELRGRGDQVPGRGKRSGKSRHLA